MGLGVSSNASSGIMIIVFASIGIARFNAATIISTRS